MHAVIVANGRPRLSAAVRAAVRRADLLICADGGIRLARRLGRPPHVIVGDVDSADPRMLAWGRRHGAAIVQHPREKDQTDTELALDHALRAGARDIDLIAVLGGRPDHALANVALLIQVLGRGRRARILDGRAELFLAGPDTPIGGRVGDLVSLIPLTASVAGVTTHGLRYPLAGAVLRVDTTLGISNQITSLPAAVRVEQGLLLIVVTHRSGRKADARTRGNRKARQRRN